MQYTMADYTLLLYYHSFKVYIKGKTVRDNPGEYKSSLGARYTYRF